MAADAVGTAIEVGRTIGPVFTLKPDTKAPSIEDGFYAARSRQDDILDMASTRPGHLWALRTGRASGIVAIDADSAEAYEYMQGRFGAPHVSTTRGGHWYFRHPGGGKVASVVKIGKNSDELPTDLDRKADGGYVGIPPLGNKSWVYGIPDKHALSVLPDDLRGQGTVTSAAHDGTVNADAANAIAVEIPPNGRHDLMLVLSGVMLRYGVSEADTAATLLKAWGDTGALSDDARRDIEGGVASTAAKLADGQPVWGVPRLNDGYPGLFDRLKAAYGWVESRDVVTGGKNRDTAGEDGGKRSAADRLYDLARARCEPFKDQYGDPYVLTGEGAVASLRSANPWLTRVMRDAEGRVARRDDLKAVSDALAAGAEQTRPLHTRYARHDDAVYIDLKGSRVVEITPAGWTEMLTTEAPVLFRPNNVSLELPSPVRGGTLNDLSAHLKPCDPASERLRAAWIVLAMLPDVSRPILETTGEPGAGKSTDQGAIKRLIDPSSGDLLTLEKGTFLQNLLFHAVPVFDNLQRIDADTSDDLCRAVTGAAFQRRALYTDEDQIVRSYKRAVAINGVAVPGERADLQDRVLPISLKRGGERRTDAELRASFDQAHPALLGAIFDALSAALRHFDPAATPPDFRLGDWALYAAGVYKHAGWDQLDADLAGIERTRSEVIVDGSPVARAVMRMVKRTVDFRVWEGTPRDLYTKCRDEADGAGELAIFPRAPNTFTARLREATQALSEHGIRVESGKSDKRRWVKIGRDGGRDDATPEPSRRDDAGTINRPGESRSHSGNASIRDGRDDASDDLYGGSLLRSKEVWDESMPKDLPRHLGDKTVPTVPAGDATTEAHADTATGRLPALKIGAQGYADPAYAVDPTELTRQLVADGTYHVRAVVSTLKKRGVADAYYRALGALAAARCGGEYEGVRRFAHNELKRVGAAKFALRRISQRRRPGYVHDVEALRDFLPHRLAWRPRNDTPAQCDRGRLDDPSLFYATAEDFDAAYVARRKYHDFVERCNADGLYEDGEILMAAILADSGAAM